MIECTDLEFDGVIDDESSDGKLTFSADSEDYKAGRVTPGVYIVTITGTAVESSPQKT